MSTRSIALVAGANEGIGLAVARRPSERDFTVWLGCRDRSRGGTEAARLRDAGLDVRAVELDVTDGGSVARAAAHLQGETEALDVLVNNAGISIGSQPPGVTEESVDDMRAMFEVNTLGPVRVTQAFLPPLRRSAAARVIMMGSAWDRSRKRPTWRGDIGGWGQPATARPRPRSTC